MDRCRLGCFDDSLLGEVGSSIVSGSVSDIEANGLVGEWVRRGVGTGEMEQGGASAKALRVIKQSSAHLIEEHRLWG